jgi:ribose transport system ATP-binding protein
VGDPVTPAAPGTEPAAVRLRAVSKRFGLALALDDVHAEFRRGQVHGLVGMNGSGKSTLIKILAGLHAPDSGQVELWGRPVTLPVRHPRRHGIAVVHQHLGLVDTLSIAESFGAGLAYQARGGHVSWRRERAEWDRYASRLDVRMAADTRIGDLSASDRTIVALIRSLRELDAAGRDRLLILDEVTVAFSPPEVRKVADVVRAIVADGGCVLFVSHHLPEVLDLADRITVLRDGRTVATLDSAGTTSGQLVQQMTGEELAASSSGPAAGPPPAGSPVIEFRNVSTRRLSDFSVQVRAGEIVGVTGLAGMGQDQLPGLLSGAVAADQGTVALQGEPPSRRLRHNLRRGLAVVPADRIRQGLWLDGSVRENITLPVFSRFFARGTIRHRRERRHAAAEVERYNVRPLDSEFPVRYLSGGNQQKVVLAKALAVRPRALVLHDPTIGVDSPARADIYRLVRAAAADTAVLVVGTDYDELALLCDRVVVLRSGRVVGELGRTGLSEQAILALCNGIAPAADLLPAPILEREHQ